MPFLKSLYAIFILGMVSFFPLTGVSHELTSNYAGIIYFNPDNLRQFNANLSLGRLHSEMRNRGGDTIEDEVTAKINVIVEKVMQVLGMYPPQLKFSIVIHPGQEEVKKEFFRIYNMKVEYIAFYSPYENRVFFSADNAGLNVVAHEIGHVVAENYFTISPPPRIHEVMAQFAERHVMD